MKKILVLSLILLMAFVIIGCEAEEETGELSEKPEKLSIIALDIDVEQFGEGAEKFEEEYGIEVEWQEFAYGDLWDQITTSITGGSTFDLYMMSNSWHPELGDLGMAVPLGDIVSEEELAQINEKYYDITIDFLSSHGEQWGLPGTAASVSFFYNESMLNDLGYSEPPTTFDEMLDMSREAIDSGLAEYGFYPGWLSAHEDGMVWFDIMLKIHGGEWMNEDRTEWTFNDERGIETLTYMKKILDEGIIPRSALEESDWSNMYHFLSGEQLFEINWNFVYSMANDPQQSEIVDDVAVGMIPGLERETYTVLGGGGYAISPTTRSKEWAFKLLDYMHREEGARGVMEEQGGAEAVIEELYNEEYDDEFPKEDYPLRDVYREQMEHAGLRPSSDLSWYSEFRDNIFTPAMHRALLGQQDIEEALNQAQQEAQELLEDRGL